MVLPKIIQLQNKLFTIRNGYLVYTKPLVSEMINGLSSWFDDLLNLRPVSNDAILAAVSTPQYKLRWVPLDRREAVSALFMAYVVGLASCAVQTSFAINHTVSTVIEAGQLSTLNRMPISCQ